MIFSKHTSNAPIIELQKPDRKILWRLTLPTRLHTTAQKETLNGATETSVNEVIRDNDCWPVHHVAPLLHLYELQPRDLDNLGVLPRYLDNRSDLGYCQNRYG